MQIRIGVDLTNFMMGSIVSSCRPNLFSSSTFRSPYARKSLCYGDLPTGALRFFFNSSSISDVRLELIRYVTMTDFIAMNY